MKYKDYINILKLLGFKAIRQRGSHQIWSNGKDTTIVTNNGHHSDVSRFIARRELKRLGYERWQEI